jgi:hypothetical protein
LRNDKHHQEELLVAQNEAEEALLNLHELVAKTRNKGLSVGKAVNLAADVGLHRYRVAAHR